MNDEEWCASGNPLKMRGFILDHAGTRTKRSRRKLRLLGCWGCRQLWQMMTDDRNRRAVEMAERLADGEAKPAEVAEAIVQAGLAATCDLSMPMDSRRLAVARSAQYVLAKSADLFSLGGFVCWSFRGWPELSGSSRGQTAAGAIRCIFGNPFRPAKIDPRWLTWSDGTLPRLAQGIYDDRAWDRLPILADALEDAGCANEDVLSHCRGTGPHTRGCWIVDLLLGKG